MKWHRVHTLVVESIRVIRLTQLAPCRGLQLYRCGPMLCGLYVAGNMTKGQGWHNCPDQLLAAIFDKLDLAEKAVAERVCKSWNEVLVTTPVAPTRVNKDHSAMLGLLRKQPRDACSCASCSYLPLLSAHNPSKWLSSRCNYQHSVETVAAGFQMTLYIISPTNVQACSLLICSAGSLG